MRVLWVLAVLSLISGCAGAASFGRLETGKIVSIEGMPALCLPDDVSEDFPVGWITLSESYGSASWGLVVRGGGRPLVLAPGKCIRYGVELDEYESPAYQVRVPILKLQANRTYVFAINSAAQPRDSYRGVFCVSEGGDGSRQYLQYFRLSDGGEITPPCDEKEHERAR